LADRSATRDWDARTYDRVAAPMTRWGAAVLDRLPLDGGETVLDAGCGSGRVTELLLGRLPRGHVIALDGSAAMIEAARSRLAWAGNQVEYLVADLGRPLPLDPGSVDAVFSTATFHWVADHPALFGHLAMVLRPGGPLVAQLGGAGNIASVRRAIDAAADEGLGDGWPGPWTFPTPEETRDALGAAGFVEVEAWLHEEPAAIAAGEPLREYLRTVVLGSHLERLPPRQRDAFVDAVARHLPSAVIDYVRLDVTARRAG
jgi:trans-aconitate 2-methyltransferase